MPIKEPLRERKGGGKEESAEGRAGGKGGSWNSYQPYWLQLSEIARGEYRENRILEKDKAGSGN